MGEGQGMWVGQVSARASHPSPLTLPLLLPLPISIPLSLTVQLRRALMVVVLWQVVALVVGGRRGGGGRRRGGGAGRVVRLPSVPHQSQGQPQAVGGRGGLASAVACSAAAVVAAAWMLLGGRVLRVHAVAPVACGAGGRGRDVGVALLGVGLAGKAGQRHVGEAQTQALRVKGLDLTGLSLQESANTL